MREVMTLGTYIRESRNENQINSNQNKIKKIKKNQINHP